MVNPFEYIPDGVGDDRPTIVQLKEYRDLMVDIVRRQGKGIRYARQGERARTRIGTEYLLPGSLTEWSEPDKKFRTKIMRDRLYSASFRTDMGANAGRAKPVFQGEMMSALDTVKVMGMGVIIALLAMIAFNQGGHNSGKAVAGDQR